MATKTDPNSYKALKAISPQACEFCDQQFKNRFNSIVHNSAHIIIPLLKHQICYCDICSIYFTSTDDFNTHINDKHHPVLNHNNDIDIKVPEIKLEKLPQFNNDIFEVKEEFDGNEYDSSSEDETLLEIVKREMERKYIQDEINDEDYTNFIKSHLKFEIDTEYDGLLNDCTTDCEVNIKYMWGKDKDTDTSNGKTKSITNCIVYEDPVDEFELNNAILSDVPLKSDEEYKSVHYSDLMSFGYYCCQYCRKSNFSNRFTLIIHETSHIKIRKIRNQYLQCPHCDVYIAGNYRTMQKHENAVHSDQQELRTCEICGLRYKKYTRHKQIYHSKPGEPLEILKKKDLVETGQELIKEPVQESFLGLVQKPDYKPNWIEKFFIIKVCDLCFSFLKNSFKKVYILKGTSRYTTEQPCDKCKKSFYVLKTVRTLVRINKNPINSGGTRSTLTNENRLKKIQTRLKMLNKMGKVYIYFLLLVLEQKSKLGKPCNMDLLVSLTLNALSKQ